MFNKFPEGYDLTIMDVRYHYPKPKDNGKWDDGSITLIAKDNINNRKVMEEIKNPSYTYYMIRDDIIAARNIDYPVKEIEKDATEPITVPYKDLEKDIASRIGELDYFYNNLKNKNRRANALLHMEDPRVLFSDMNIEDYYRFQFSLKFKNTICKIDKSFMDIEVDAKKAKGDFPLPGECPINAITFIDMRTQTSYTLLLRTSGNPQIAQFEEELKHGAIKEFKDLLIEHVGGWKNLHRYGLQNLKFKFSFYNEDDEILLIQDLFNLINGLQPDFVLAWNMAFDIPYIIARIKQLGYNPEDIMCHPDFKTKEADYFVDTRTELLYERGDFAKISSYSIYLDQMIQHASIRKGQSAYASYKLDYVTNLICNFGKLDYHHITPFIAELPYASFKTFVFYNIIDVIDQIAIEHKVKDIDFIFTKALSNNTRYSKIHRQTVYLVNKLKAIYWSEGYIMGNNVNKANPKPTEKFSGAFVASPLNIGPFPKLKLNGIPIMIYDNLDDYDYRRLYPSILQEFNITDPTQIGKVIIPEQVHSKENLTGETKIFDRGGTFLDDLATNSYIEFCHRWFHLADFGQLLEDLNEYFNLHPTYNPVSLIQPDGTRTFYRKIDENNQPLRPFYKFTTRNKDNIVSDKQVPMINNSLVGEIDANFSSTLGFKYIRDQFDSEDFEN